MKRVGQSATVLGRLRQSTDDIEWAGKRRLFLFLVCSSLIRPSAQTSVLTYHNEMAAAART
jgi:hypothetical protein